MNNSVSPTTDPQLLHTLTDDEAKVYIDLKCPARDMVRLAFPDASDDLCDHVLWEWTPWPVVNGVHDLADAMARLIAAGPRCGAMGETGPCNRRVSRWFTRCYMHAGGVI